MAIGLYLYELEHSRIARQTAKLNSYTHFNLTAGNCFKNLSVTNVKSKNKYDKYY